MAFNLWGNPVVKIKVNGSEGAIFPSSKDLRLSGTEDPGWKPSEADVREAEALLRPFLESQITLYKNNLRDFKGNDEERKRFQLVVDGETAKLRLILSRLKDYRRQYFGIVEKGRRLLWINFLLGGAEGWDKKYVDVQDGGAAYFNLKVDLQTKSCLDLSINGEA